MMGEARDEAGVEVVVLAASAEDAAIATCDETVVGAPTNLTALENLAAQCDVLTFDHELVDLDQLATLEERGVVLRPGPGALRFAVDKAFQRRELVKAGLPVPRFVVVDKQTVDRGDDQGDDRAGELKDLLADLSTPPVIKTARGGYDGRGVAFPSTMDEARELIGAWRARGEVVVEERLELRAEVAQLVARDVAGRLALYPVVDTLQQAGMCVEVRYPSSLAPTVLHEITRLTTQLGELIAGVGVLAVEYFLTDAGVCINEVALRPHNTGHWTIEGTTTSQFAQHLRAVAGFELGPVTPLAPYAVMVNVVGGEHPSTPEAARQVAGVAVHDYGKSWRPGRKLGHVTALGADPESAHVRAWAGAKAYGTSAWEA